ncbi:sialate O-acetylesterase [Mucilaginibacter sp.]|uniref:sialate O-acetylesterase n=1 Tax=Mucilaginibacter sp. TaxID=1882438 RepID=UPI002625677D|nr:sialate O-acetylesterase [Mucilaginibacter sp.]MDB4923990.1 hypothetical protein [Mucilaginibacter sp.]
MKKYFLLLICLIAAINSNAQKPDPKFELYILAGQSNMAGRGYITDDIKNEGNDKVYMLTKDSTWVLAKHPVHFDKPTAGVGPGLSFAIAMTNANPNIKIGLIPCAVGGTPIEHWLPGAYDAATKTHPYDDAIKRIKFAMQFGDIKGIIWHQGESNTTPEKAKVYLAQLTELIGRLRSLVNNPRLPFVAGELGRYRPEFVYINTELAKLPATVPFTALVTSEDLVHRGDTLHFNSSSAQVLGRRYAVKMLQLQKGKR